MKEAPVKPCMCITNYTCTKLTGSMSSKKNIDDLNIIIKLCFTLFLKVPIIIIDTDRDAQKNLDNYA